METANINQQIKVLKVIVQVLEMNKFAMLIKFNQQETREYFTSYDGDSAWRNFVDYMPWIMDNFDSGARSGLMIKITNVVSLLDSAAKLREHYIKMVKAQTRVSGNITSIIFGEVATLITNNAVPSLKTSSQEYYDELTRRFPEPEKQKYKLKEPTELFKRDFRLEDSLKLRALLSDDEQREGKIDI